MRAAPVALSGERSLPEMGPAGLGSLPRPGISVRNSEFVARRCFGQSCQQLQAGSVCSSELKLPAKI